MCSGDGEREGGGASVGEVGGKPGTGMLYMDGRPRACRRAASSFARAESKGAGASAEGGGAGASVRQDGGSAGEEAGAAWLKGAVA